jgi:hypothetical protein
VAEAVWHRGRFGALPAWTRLEHPTDEAQLAMLRLYGTAFDSDYRPVVRGRVSITSLIFLGEDLEIRGFRRCARWLIARMLAQAPADRPADAAAWAPVYHGGRLHFGYSLYVFDMLYSFMWSPTSADSVRRVALATGAPPGVLEWAGGDHLVSMLANGSSCVAPRWMLKRYRPFYESRCHGVPYLLQRLDEVTGS